MNEKLFISHSVYLTPEERKRLASEPTTLETIGISVPANTNDLTKKLTEIFVRYLISTESSSDKKIELMSDGYKISFPHHAELKPILNINEQGSEWFLIEFDNEIDRNGETLSIHHTVIFKDVSVQERTTICDQLGRFLLKKK